MELEQVICARCDEPFTLAAPVGREPTCADCRRNMTSHQQITIILDALATVWKETGLEPERRDYEQDLRAVASVHIQRTRDNRAELQRQDVADALKLRALANLDKVSDYIDLVSDGALDYLDAALDLSAQMRQVYLLNNGAITGSRFDEAFGGPAGS